MSRHFLLHWHDSRIHYLHILYMYYFYREQLCNQQSDHNDSKNHYFNALNWLPNGQLFFALLSIWMIKVCITVTGFWKTVICPKVTRGKKCPSTTSICVGAQKCLKENVKKNTQDSHETHTRVRRDSLLIIINYYSLFIIIDINYYYQFLLIY